MEILTKTQISILANKGDVVNLFTELDIPFNSIEGKTVEQLKDLVEGEYQQKRNALSYEWEELKSKGDNQAAELKGNYNIAFDKRYKNFLNTIDNIGYRPTEPPTEAKTSKKRNYKRLITGIIFSLLSIGLISFFAILYFQTNEKLKNILEAREIKGKEKGKEEATIVLNNVFKIKEDSLKQANQKEQEALESKFKNDKDGLISEYKKLLDKQEQEFAKSRKELNNANTEIGNRDAEISQKTSEITNLNKRLFDESKKQKIVTVHDTVVRSSPQMNKEIQGNGNEQNYFEELLQMKNSEEIKSFEIDISEKKYDKDNSKDTDIKSKVKSIKEAINTKGKK